MAGPLETRSLPIKCGSLACSPRMLHLASCVLSWHGIESLVHGPSPCMATVPPACFALSPAGISLHGSLDIELCLRPVSCKAKTAGLPLSTICRATCLLWPLIEGVAGSAAGVPSSAERVVVGPAACNRLWEVRARWALVLLSRLNTLSRGCIWPELLEPPECAGLKERRKAASCPPAARALCTLLVHW